MKLRYIIKTFFHYFKANLLVALGVAVSTMVLTGSLIIGDSVKWSLKQAAFYRLGETTHLVTVTEKYFRMEMAGEIEKENQSVKAEPILLLEGMAVARGGQVRTNKVQVIGTGRGFDKFARTSLYKDLADNEIAISRNLAERMDLKEGENLLVRIKKASLIPMNAPFVASEETNVSLRAVIKHIVEKEELGRFSLKNSQTAPYNIFLSIDRLNRLMDFEGKANQILISTELETAEIKRVVGSCLTPLDAGLRISKMEKSGEISISTERVFLENNISSELFKLPGASPLLSYFVNEISSGTGSAPYSFVSSVDDKRLGSKEIILNQWAAEDLTAEPGDSITLKYFEIGPLRQLVEKEAKFRIAEIIPMSDDLCDPERVPHLPGLSDAGHCREWEAGVPINLDAIREKDEKYWEIYKATPKAFVSYSAATGLWANRFGDHTAFMYPEKSFNRDDLNALFKNEIKPADLGMAIEPVRETALTAAQNGTDFSGLFIGLSFFILAASVILTSLLFLLNLESRSSQVETMSALGFGNRSVRYFFLSEGMVVSLFGSVIGILLSVWYTKLVFNVLNTLWFDIVRTNVLEMKMEAITLIEGMIISVVVSFTAIYISVKRHQKKKSFLSGQKRGKGRWKVMLVKTGGFVLPLLAILIFILQLRSEQLNASMFFLAGGLLLTGLLMMADIVLSVIKRRRRNKFGPGELAIINMVRNKSRSLTIIALFALGTFLVISTGSNRSDLFADADKPASGTGGFMFFAESTIPVLYNINNEEKRAEEGFQEAFKVVQFRKIEGDDASCLNLNRVLQPAVLGVDPEKLAGRFSFSTRLKGLPEEDPWMLLNRELDDGTIPAIADQTVIQWGLGKKIGDVLLYQNELGDTVKIKLIAGTAPSIFQGYLIISNKYFLENYPSSSGTNLFLVEGERDKMEQVRMELESVYRDNGWEMEDSAKRLAEFYSVTNTYLSIFLALGALGLILGTIGLAIILARTILERKREIAVMRAMGHKVQSIFKMLVTEYLLLLLAGVLTGFVTAMLATLPAFISTNTDASFFTVFTVLILVIFNGAAWVTGLSWFALRKKVLVKELKTE